MSSALMDALALGAVYALIAVGYTLVYGVIKLINFAHGEFFMGGAFAGYFVLEYVGTGSQWADFGLAVLAGAGVASVLALATERIAYRPLRREGLAAVRIGEILVPLLGAATIIGCTPVQHGWTGLSVAIVVGVVLSRVCGRAIEGMERRSIERAVRGATIMVFAATVVCVAATGLREWLWSATGWGEGTAFSWGRLGGVGIGATVAGVVMGLATRAFAGTRLSRAGRIAGLLTALGVSLVLQTLAMRLWTAGERGVHNPFEWEHHSLEELALGALGTEHGDVTYYTRSGAGGPKRVFIADAGEEVSEEGLAAAREAGARWIEVRVTDSGQKGMLVLVVTVLATAGLTVIVKYTRYGKAIRALSEDADAARLVGVDPDRVIALTFFLGAALAGVAGVLIGITYGGVRSMMGYTYGIKAFIAAVIGGIGSIPGACVGGLVMGISERLFAEMPHAAWRDVAAFGLLILILLARPSGILGRKTVKRV